jgi:hypothetical protein
MHLEHKAFEMQIIYAPINLPEVSSRLSLKVKAKAASKLYLKCPELPGSTQKAGMHNGVGPAAAANKFEFSCLDMRSPRMFSQKQNKKFGY